MEMGGELHVPAALPRVNIRE